MALGEICDAKTGRGKEKKKRQDWTREAKKPILLPAPWLSKPPETKVALDHGRLPATFCII